MHRFFNHTLIFNISHKLLKDNDRFHYSGKALEQVNEVRYLGTIFQPMEVLSVQKTLNPTSPAVWVVRQAGEEARKLRGQDAKNQSYHQPIEMNFRMSNYSYKSMPDIKSGFGSFSSFGDMTSQNFPFKKGTSHRIRIFAPENGFNSKKSFSFISTQNWPLMSISAIFKQWKFFYF